MARSVQEIKKQMTDAFMADELIREKYQLQEGDTFDARFSLVSLENILFYYCPVKFFRLNKFKGWLRQ